MFDHRICRPHPRCFGHSGRLARDVRGNTTGEPLATAAHWLCKGLTASNPKWSPPGLSCRATGVSLVSPRHRSWREACRSRRTHFGVRTALLHPGGELSLDAGGFRLQRVMALPPVSLPAAGMYLLCWLFNFQGTGSARRQGITPICFRKFVNHIVARKNSDVNSISQKS